VDGDERALALDFDGVICDSAREAFVVALRTWAELRPDAPSVRNVAGATAASRPALYAHFVEHMPLGNRAEDYAVVLAALDAEVPLPDQPAYDRFLATLPQALLARFHRRFYEVRDAWREADPEAWCEEMAPYQGFVGCLRRRAPGRTVAIATAKDRASVELLLRHYGLADVFGPRDLVDKEAGRSKRAHLEQLAERTGIPLAAWRFVDDKVNHLEDVAALGVDCVLASWGYNGQREIELARARGFTVCGLDDAEALLFGPPSSGRVA